MTEGAAARALGLPAARRRPKTHRRARPADCRRDEQGMARRARLDARSRLDLVIRRLAGGDDRATCEVTPHHLTFTDEIVARFGPAASVNPPLRTARRRRGAARGVRDGTIDAFASDHAPHTPRKSRDGRGRRSASAGSSSRSAPTRRRCPICRCRASSSCCRPIPRASSPSPAARLRVGAPADVTSSPTAHGPSTPSELCIQGQVHAVCRANVAAARDRNDRGWARHLSSAATFGYDGFRGDGRRSLPT